MKWSLLACFVLLTAPARAEAPDANAKRFYLAGQQAYEAGRYEVAIKAFESANAIAPADLLLFDLAQAYRKKHIVLGDRAALEKSIELYRRFLASPATGRERIKAAEALNEALLLAAREGAAAPPGPGASPAAAKTEIMIVTEAVNARVALDDRAASPMPLLETVSPGEHRAHIT